MIAPRSSSHRAPVKLLGVMRRPAPAPRAKPGPVCFVATWLRRFVALPWKRAITKRSRWDLTQRVVPTGVSSECPNQNEPDSKPTGPSVAEPVPARRDRFVPSCVLPTAYRLRPTASPISAFQFSTFLRFHRCHMMTLGEKTVLAKRTHLTALLEKHKHRRCDLRCEFGRLTQCYPKGMPRMRIRRRGETTPGVRAAINTRRRRGCCRGWRCPSWR